MKKLIIVMTLSCMTLGLTACGEKKPEPPKASAVASPVASAVQASVSDAVQGDWKEIKSTSEATLYINVNSIDKVKHTAWAKMVGDKGEQVVLFETDCGHKIRRLVGALYKNKTKIQDFGPSNWDTAFPDTPLGSVKDYICK